MALSTLRVRRDTVDVENAEGGTTTLTLYGLGADAVAFLAQEHGPVLGALYNAAIKGEINVGNVEQSVVRLLNEAPLLAASVIAFGCREPEAMEQAADLPVGVQILALQKIFHLTFASEASLKKVGEIVSTLGAAMNGLLSPAPSTSGSQASTSASAS